MIVLKILFYIIVFSTLLLILPNLIIAIILYRLLFVRTSKSKWSRKCSNYKGKDHVKMFSKGIEWAEEQQEFKQSVNIYNKGFNLFGEFFYFGFDKAVIIIPGRTEGCQYSYYYAVPYKNLGYNVLVIDTRCHGLSDGKYLTFGIKDYTDILQWGKFLHEIFGINSIILHGICLGAATSLHTLTSENLPEYFSGMIADGMFPTFYAIFRNHIIHFKQPTFPVLQIVMFMIKNITKVDAKNNGPVFCIEKLQKPILFIHSKQDKYSLPEEVIEVYNKCHSQKSIVWFEKGNHSHIRIADEEKYDLAIKNFISELPH